MEDLQNNHNDQTFPTLWSYFLNFIPTCVTIVGSASQQFLYPLPTIEVFIRSAMGSHSFDIIKKIFGQCSFLIVAWFLNSIGSVCIRVFQKGHVFEEKNVTGGHLRSPYIEGEADRTSLLSLCNCRDFHLFQYRLWTNNFNIFLCQGRFISGWQGLAGFRGP